MATALLTDVLNKAVESGKYMIGITYYKSEDDKLHHHLITNNFLYADMIKSHTKIGALVAQGLISTSSKDMV